MLRYTFNRLQTGEPQTLCQFEGKVLLIVNTASKCGFTPQYKNLEAVYEEYKEKGFEILAFPANEFGKQEPGSNAEIKATPPMPSSASKNVSGSKGLSPNSIDLSRRAPARNTCSGCRTW